MILPECRWMWEGVEGADSLVLNPHKWLGAAFDCSLYYVRDPEHLIRVMGTNPSYLRTRRRERGEDLSRLGHPARPPLPRAEALVPVARRGRRGAAGAAAARSRQRPLARRRSRAARRLAACSRPFRCRRSASATSRRGSKARRSTATRSRWVEAANRSGRAYLTPAILDGRWMVRVSIGALATERADVEALWALMREEAEGG